MSGAAYLELDRLTRRFGDTPAVLDLSLEIREHEVVTLLGPSGCGKTTTLRMVAGFETPDAGRITLDGRDVTGTKPQYRGFGMVFQHYALFPHLSVGENVAFGLDAAGASDDEIDRRVAAALELVGLPGVQGRSIGSLSGGQQQRVALARALAPRPRVLLLDEPLSNLDATLRERTRRELRSLMSEIGITSLYVTHDQEEAFDLSDRIGVMREGRLEQVGTGEELYHRPATAFVATFLGRVGALESRVTAAGDETVECRVAEGVTWRCRLPPAGSARELGTAVRILARPEALELVGPESGQALPGRVTARRFAGSFYLYRVDVAGGALEVQTRDGGTRPGARVGLRPIDAPRGLFAFPTGDAVDGEVDGR